MSRSKANQSDSYHHGDLRNSLIALGSEMLAEEGAQALSLRKLARRAGVSHNAPYMHFADKEALLAAVAEEGFRALTADVDAAVTAAGEAWEARLQAAAWAYVHFCLTHPGHVQVMFRFFEPEQHPDLFAASTASFAQLRQLVAEGQTAQQVKAGDSSEAAGLLWSLLHGVSLILAGRKMPAAVMNGREAEALVAAFVRRVLVGLGV